MSDVEHGRLTVKAICDVLCVSARVYMVAMCCSV